MALDFFGCSDQGRIFFVAYAYTWVDFLVANLVSNSL